MTNISFDLTEKEMTHIMEICDSLGLEDDARMGAIMDLAATHKNGCPLDLEKMEEAAKAGPGELGHVWHDLAGIARHLDRNTGRLMDGFRPRFAKNQ